MKIRVKNVRFVLISLDPDFMTAVIVKATAYFDKTKAAEAHASTSSTTALEQGA